MNRALVICGATASGKTALAVECAKRLNGEVISADALLVYRGLNIGTAKPTAEEMQGIPHYMIDVVDPRESFSVSDYERMALPVLEEIFSRGKVPILCGGTGFYMNALLYRRSLGKVAANENVRRKYEQIAAERGNGYLHSLLEEVDAESAEKLHENDVKRVVRALEIYELTGKRKSEQNDGDEPRIPYRAVAFDYPREELYARINARVDAMLQAGLVEEVEGLLKDGVSPNSQCMQGIGYKEVVEILKNEDLHSTMSDKINTTTDIINTMRDIIQKNTRNYAKRQLTFFRKYKINWIKPKPLEEAAREVITYYESGTDFEGAGETV